MMVVFGATGDTTKFTPLQSRSFFPSTGGGRGLSLPAWLRAPEAVPGTDALMLLRRMGKAPLEIHCCKSQCAELLNSNEV